MFSRALYLCGALTISLPSYAQVSSEFLTTLQSKFKQSLGFPINESHFTQSLSDEEQSLLNETSRYDYTDIFEGTQPKDDDTFPYLFLKFRGLRQLIDDNNWHQKITCNLVKTKDDGKTFKVSRIKAFRHLQSKSSSPDEWRFSYCTGHDTNADMSSVMYYFHGITGQPSNWLERKAMYEFRKRWREMGKAPQWVSISFGSIAHLGQIGFEEKFFEKIIPYIEKELGFDKRPRKRFGFGVSQGGANVVHTVLKNESFFDAAVAICPAVFSFPPSASEEEQRAYRHRTMASRFLFRLIFSILPEEFMQADYWSKNVDPFQLGLKYLNENSTPLYIQTSSKDQLGLQEGGQLFAMLARTMGAPVVFEELKGGHCVMRAKKTADFFRSFQEGELPLQLQMHGRTRR